MKTATITAITALLALAAVAPAIAQEQFVHYCDDGATATIVGDELRIKGGKRDGEVLGPNQWFRNDPDEDIPEHISFMLDPENETDPTENPCWLEPPQD